MRPLETPALLNPAPPLRFRRGGWGVRFAHAVVLVASVLLLLAPPSSAQEPFTIPDVTISGGSLPAPVRLAPTDADAFRRRINLPPRLEFVPQPTGPSYTVTSAYWNDAIDREDSAEERLAVDEDATYWPEGGFVLTMRGEEEVWTVLDLRQRPLLDRYIRLGSTGAISAREGNLGVLSAANATEYIGIDAGVKPLTEQQRSAFWAGLGTTQVTFLDPFEPPQPDGDGFWLLLTIADGPGYEYYYDGSTLTDSFGSERYAVNPALQSFLNELAPAMPEIDNEDPPGSLLWWPVMGGGGLVLIGAAWWLNRRNEADARA